MGLYWQYWNKLPSRGLRRVDSTWLKGLGHIFVPTDNVTITTSSPKDSIAMVKHCIRGIIDFGG